MQDRGFDDVMSDIRALNAPFRVMAPAIQAGFTTRLKSEQAEVRKTVIHEVAHHFGIDDDRLRELGYG